MLGKAFPKVTNRGHSYNILSIFSQLSRQLVFGATFAVRSWNKTETNSNINCRMIPYDKKITSSKHLSPNSFIRTSSSQSINCSTVSYLTPLITISSNNNDTNLTESADTKKLQPKTFLKWRQTLGSSHTVQEKRVARFGIHRWSCLRKRRNYG